MSQKSEKVGVVISNKIQGSDGIWRSLDARALYRLTVAASGYVLGNTLLIVAGTLVGASGTILTRLMAAAMGRPWLPGGGTAMTR